MSKYRRYERYKDSGVEWIEEIPEHWDITKLGYRARMIVPMRDKPTEFNGNIPWIRIEDVDGKYIEDSKSEQRVSEELVKKMNLKVYPIGTVLCTCSCNMGTTVIVKKPLISNQTFIGIVPMKDLDSTFLYYAMNANSKRLQHLAEGAIQQYLSRHDFEHLKLAFPDKKEQTAIANFLDQKTAEIDGLITDKEKLIELLQEKRQAIITEAVTKGLNSSVRMKDSGIEWIGEIPEHWDIRRIKYLSNIRNVKASDGDNDKTYVGLESIESKTGKLLTNNNDEQQAVGETANIFRKGDVLFGKLRPYLAKCIVADFNGRCTSELLVLRTASNMLPEYLYLFMLSPIFIDVVNSSTYGAKMPRASWDFIGNLKVPLPNIKEQEEIVEYLIKLTNNMDDLISDISTQIQKLKEYRQSLISEAVTGKVDVREFENMSEVINE
ncbi:restriction endonuclease subunit S [Proteiniborus sp. MB09-C3]|uniref:restriction endonuclease subunit S n=1 Tax=Proteiniborus sp. MB09-C3 TaxID=3050072 RepID=UPI002552627B|nr:restriction endonuclease subunit S [Proteiniborus sp. MB09-C3]WIV12818.1 restriction endonuclease subunit S [Proteiniborus sp. MB09-C3]